MANRIPPLNPLRNFEAAARLGSFKLAADELCVTEGAVSRQIKVLEAHLGISLFHRGGRKVTLSESGERLFPTIRDALNRITDATEELIHQPRILRVECSTSFALRWLMPRLHRFEATVPDIKINLQTTVADISYPPSRLMDASIIYMLDTPADDPRLRLIIEEYLLPVCSPRLLDDGRPLTSEELRNKQLIFNEQTGRDWRRWAYNHSMHNLSWDRAIKLDSDDAAIQAAVAGYGIALANVIFVTNEFRAGNLVAAAAVAPAIVGAHYLYIRNGGQNFDGTQAFSNWLHDEIAADQELLIQQDGSYGVPGTSPIV